MSAAAPGAGPQIGQMVVYRQYEQRAEWQPPVYPDA